MKRVGPVAAGLARAAYSTLLRALTPLVLLRLLWRARREPLYGQALGERLGFYGAASSPSSQGHASTLLWLHAVSLGETRAAAALIASLRRAQPGLRLLLTHGTATGRAAGAELLLPGDLQVWLPYDTPGATRRFFARFQPAIGVLMETEVWPNLVAAAAQAGVPVVLANARLSAKSARRGERLAALIYPAARRLAACLAQTEADATRLRATGAEPVEVLGNLKYDVQPDPALLARGAAWRASLARPVVVAANTREGEEADLLRAWCATPSPRPLLLIVPRHPQRFDAVAALVEAAGLSLARRSGWGDALPGAEGQPSNSAADVWLGDSVGEMPLYYAMADVALLGGSFAPLGGHNLIEAAACGCPVVMGPSTFNFAQAAELALQASVAWREADLDAAVARALGLLALDPAEVVGLRKRARAYAASRRGAADRMAARILSLRR